MAEPRFRTALISDSDLLNEMTLAGVRHWGHHEDHPDAYDALAKSLSALENVEHNTVYVLEKDGQIIAFYDLRDRGDHVELLRMFQQVELIGQGYGRMLWEHCVQEAATMRDRMLIMSDPRAVGFYEAMGAKLERMEEVAPGLSLGVFWYDLH